MKGFIVAAFAFVVASTAAAAQSAAQGPRVTGTILRYECGDNCWLTIRWGNKQELTALCLAKECAAWNQKAEMPKRFVGRKVAATLGAGMAVDGNGDIQDYAIAVTTLKID